MLLFKKMLVSLLVICLCWTTRLHGITLNRVVVDEQEIVDGLIGLSDQHKGRKGNGDDVNQLMLQMWDQIPASLTICSFCLTNAFFSLRAADIATASLFNSVIC